MQTRTERQERTDIMLIKRLLTCRPGLTVTQISTELGLPMQLCKGYLLRMSRSRAVEATVSKRSPNTYRIRPGANKPVPAQRDWLQVAFFGEPRKATSAQQGQSA